MPARTRISGACAAAGVLLLLVASALPDDWYPALPFFLGLALIAASHVLTPCQDQITRWWRHRILKM
ncbi:MAG: hypothetical protein ACT4P4_14595 [Betaproteobacteria bacterium]